MIFTLCAKVLGTGAGLVLAWKCPESRLLTAAVLGIAPIWLEVAATLATGREPSLETRPAWRAADAAVDALSFVLIPAVWLGVQFPNVGFDTAIFTFCGLYRLGRFLKKGLVDSQYFEGLPVTYTGYVWLPCVFFLQSGWPWAAQVALYLASFLMVWTRFKVKRTQTRHDATSAD